ncbi:hypothetical protein [Paenibacillus etheri]|uniref:Uncharacterized protein n=1 Tax=Paenibacillus etheri TaxID=1306852 RepID=A0A0W1AX00_9BACL|nr:hypothetical protein [Paenibacillus etheri]KTD85779.1 hypothetical protein UQ64_20070 [Paenibacillus etheri]
MKSEELSQGRRIRIKDGQPNGYGSRTGRLVAIEVIVDIGEPLLLRVGPEALEVVPEDPLPPGWEEVEI